VWDTLLEFLLDPRVAMSEKIRPLVMLGDRQLRLPKEIARTLKDALPDLDGFADAFASRDELEAAKLQVGARVNAFQRQDYVARLVAMMAADPFARIQAANCLPVVQKHLGRDVTVGLTLSIAKDRHPDVRAAAAYALARVQLASSDKALVAMTVARLHELLGEPGTVVPLGALAGLRQEVAEGRSSAVPFTRQAEHLSRSHASHMVRSSARALLEASAGLAEAPGPAT
jgi:hypothetical protein